jgi:hypothetical protein
MMRQQELLCGVTEATPWLQCSRCTPRIPALRESLAAMGVIAAGQLHSVPHRQLSMMLMHILRLLLANV